MTEIVSIHSFRGGTGKSNLTANLAATLASQGQRVAIIDTDVQSPGIHALFGLEGDQITHSLNDFLAEPKRDRRGESVEISGDSVPGFPDQLGILDLCVHGCTSVESAEIGLHP